MQLLTKASWPLLVALFAVGCSREAPVSNTEAINNDVGFTMIEDAYFGDEGPATTAPATGHSSAEHTGTDRTGADHTGADGTGADHTGADRTGADHTGADHTGADRTGADGAERAPVKPLPASHKIVSGSPNDIAVTLPKVRPADVYEADLAQR